MSDKPGDVGLWVTAIVIVGAIVLLFVALLNTAKAETPSTGVAFCSLWARESARIDLMHTLPLNPTTVTDDYITALAVRLFKECVSVIPALLPLPPEHRSLETWVADMRTLLISRAGTEPAMAGDTEWREQCARTYRTWEEDTGTVIRVGSPDRVKCPCGQEVQCE